MHEPKNGNKRKKQWKNHAQPDSKRLCGQQAIGSAACAKGSSGVLITCDRRRERQCTRDALNILNELADKHFPRQETETEGLADSVQDQLAAEIKMIQSDANKRITGRFTPYDTGVSGIVLIQCVDETVPVIDLIQKLFSDLNDTQTFPSRCINRMVPLQRIGYANEEEIKSTVKELIESNGMLQDSSPVTEYCVEVKRRSCGHLKSLQVINFCVDLLDTKHKVNLMSPKVVILIEIFRNTFGMSIVSDYHALKRYNVRSVIDPPKKENVSEEMLAVKVDTVACEKETIACAHDNCAE